MFRDRVDAGDVLAGRLGHYAGRDDGGARPATGRGAGGGAGRLGPSGPAGRVRRAQAGRPRARGAGHGREASGGVQVVNEQVVDRLRLNEAVLDRVAEAEGRELTRREQRYRQGRALPDLTGQVVILVDDGLATGSTMRAAVAAARRLGPSRVVVAVPTAPASTCQRLREEADEGCVRHHPPPLPRRRLLLPLVPADHRRGGHRHPAVPRSRARARATGPAAWVGARPPAGPT